MTKPKKLSKSISSKGVDSSAICAMKWAARRLFFERMKRKLTMRQLAELSGVSKGTICQLENCGRSMTLTTMWKLANAMDLQPHTFLVGRLRNPPTLDDAI